MAEGEGGYLLMALAGIRTGTSQRASNCATCDETIPAGQWKMWLWTRFTWNKTICLGCVCRGFQPKNLHQESGAIPEGAYRLGMLGALAETVRTQEKMLEYKRRQLNTQLLALKESMF